MASGWNLRVWFMSVVVRRYIYIDILIIIITFPYSSCISSFFGSIIPISLFIFKMIFRSCLYINIAKIRIIHQTREARFRSPIMLYCLVYS